MGFRKAIFALLIATATLLAVPAESARASSGGAVCSELENCWQRLFPEVRNIMAGTMAFVDSTLERYEVEARRNIEAAGSKEKQRLSYQAATCNAYLRECESLSELARSGAPADVIVLGRPMDTDGNNFERVAIRAYQERVKERCGSLESDREAFNACRKRIVLLQEPGKSRLMNFMRLLKPNSITSFTYVGHGMENQILLGKRSLERSADSSFVLHRHVRSHEEDGAIYIEDLLEGKGFADSLSTAFDPDAKITFLACNTGQKFAGMFAHASGVKKGAMASEVGMHFALFDKRTGKVVKDTGPMGDVREPKGNEYVWLVPDKKGKFKNVDPKNPNFYIPAFSKEKSINWLGSARPDEDAKRLATMAFYGTGRGVSLIEDDGRTEVEFTKEERSKIRKLFGSKKRIDSLENQEQVLNVLSPAPTIRKKMEMLLDRVKAHREVSEWVTAHPEIGFTVPENMKLGLRAPEKK